MPGVFNVLRRLLAAANARLGGKPTGHLNRYCTTAPHPQNALDIFAGEWTSAFPPPFDALNTGYAPLYDDPRLQWAIAHLGGVRGKRILELGPLEGAHTYLLERAGAAEVLAIEGHHRAYLKCLVTKELLGLRAARFVCGDFVPYLRDTHERFDVVVASGVLYHLVNPVELIARVAAITSAAYLWTHYYDEALFKAAASTASRVVKPEPAEHLGYRHALHRHQYRSAALTPGFCGGNRPYANWLTRADILGALHFFGFTRVEVAFEEPAHMHGPAFALLAMR